MRGDKKIASDCGADGRELELRKSSDCDYGFSGTKGGGDSRGHSIDPSPRGGAGEGARPSTVGDRNAPFAVWICSNSQSDICRRRMRKNSDRDSNIALSGGSERNLSIVCICLRLSEQSL